MPTTIKQVRDKLMEIEDGGVLATPNASLFIKRNAEDDYAYSLGQNFDEGGVTRAKIEGRIKGWQADRFNTIRLYTDDQFKALLEEHNGNAAEIRATLYPEPTKVATANPDKKRSGRKPREQKAKAEPKPRSTFRIEAVDDEGNVTQTIEESISRKDKLAKYGGHDNASAYKLIAAKVGSRLRVTNLASQKVYNVKPPKSE